MRLLVIIATIASTTVIAPVAPAAEPAKAAAVPAVAAAEPALAAAEPAEAAADVVTVLKAWHGQC